MEVGEEGDYIAIGGVGGWGGGVWRLGKKEII